jgi:hypothetical protein
MAALPRKRRLVVRAVGSETIVYDTGTHRAHCLGPEAAAVWRECDGRRSTSEIAERLRLAGGQPIEEASVAVALRRLERAGLVDGQASRTAGGPQGRGAGAVGGRRAALRRVAALAGLAVASMVAPAPEAAAATCKPNWPTTGSQCQASSECCSNCCSNLIAPPSSSVCLRNPPPIGQCR